MLRKARRTAVEEFLNFLGVAIPVCNQGLFALKSKVYFFLQNIHHLRFSSS